MTERAEKKTGRRWLQWKSNLGPEPRHQELNGRTGHSGGLALKVIILPDWRRTEVTGRPGVQMVTRGLVPYRWFPFLYSYRITHLTFKSSGLLTYSISPSHLGDGDVLEGVRFHVKWFRINNGDVTIDKLLPVPSSNREHAHLQDRTHELTRENSRDDGLLRHEH